MLKSIKTTKDVILGLTYHYKKKTYKLM